MRGLALSRQNDRGPLGYPPLQPCNRATVKTSLQGGATAIHPTERHEVRDMGTVIPQTKHDVLPPGTYRVRVGAVAVEDGIYGT